MHGEKEESVALGTSHQPMAQRRTNVSTFVMGTLQMFYDDDDDDDDDDDLRD